MTVDQDKAEVAKPSLFRRAGRTTVRTVLTLGFAAIAVLAVQVGSQELANRANAAPAPDPAPIMPVTTAPIVLEPGYAVSRSFVGQIEAQRTVAVSFELSGQLDGIGVDEGQTVEQGQQIATLDNRLLNSERDRLVASKSALEAQLRFAKQTVERQTQLRDSGAVSQAGLDQALARADELSARIAEIDALLTANAIQLEKSMVYAPFAGRVTSRTVDGGESVGPGQAIVEIVENSAPHLRVGVPIDITNTDLAAATVEIEGAVYEANLVTFRPDIDPVTRTRTAIFEITAETALAFGQTARVLLTDTVEAEGLWVPVTTLKEGLRGQWTLLVVDNEDIVRALSVQVLHTQGDRVFVRGAFPSGVELITAGPQRVTVGQSVDPQPAI